MTDIKEHCCGANMLFDSQTAQKQYKRYLKRGPSRVTKKLIGQLEKMTISGSLIDIGGGIGAIQWWFLKHGGESTYGVDASMAYTETAKEHAFKNNFIQNTQFLIGDFTEKAKDLPNVDHLTLDKVICCYPNFSAILNLACTKSNKSISLSYPMNGIIANLFRGIGVLYMKLKGNAFRPYVHQANNVRTLMIQNGFELKEKEVSFPWHIETYVKNN